MRALFVTGTDTGVGKTTVSRAILRAVWAPGRDVIACKPIATGADGLSDDTLQLADAARMGSDWHKVTRWTFREPAAPPVAAFAEGVRLDFGEIVREVRRRASDAEFTLIEGVGGLLCPLTDRETVADLIAELGCPTVVVTRRSLGTLNHTLLTLEVAANRGLDVCGLVVNETERAEGLAGQTNVEELRRRTGVPILAVCPYCPETPGEIDLSEVDWWSLAGPD